jgi:hypothetical protein
MASPDPALLPELQNALQAALQSPQLNSYADLFKADRSRHDAIAADPDTAASFTRQHFMLP